MRSAARSCPATTRRCALAFRATTASSTGSRDLPSSPLRARRGALSRRALHPAGERVPALGDRRRQLRLPRRPWPLPPLRGAGVPLVAALADRPAAEGPRGCDRGLPPPPLPRLARLGIQR